MRYRLLGPLEVFGDDGAPIALRGPRERVLLATLVLGASRTVSTSRLIDALWGEDPPPTATNTLQVHLSRLRKKLAGDRSGGPIESSASGYVLSTRPGEVDLECFEALIHKTPDDPAEEAALLQEALELWRGPALAGVSSDLLMGERARLDELRIVTLERRIDAELSVGRHGELVGELESLVHDHPLRESLRRQLIVALYRSGRQADALATYRQGRDILAEELGIDPSPDLQKLELAILNQSPELNAPSSESTTVGTSSRPSGTVTFLFTDIEGSTRLWEASPDLTAQAVRRHDEIMRTSIEASGGYVFKAMGDGFCVAFDSAIRGIQAARAAQELLNAEPWPAPVDLRVRMALHTGSCEEREGDYFGPTLNRTARLVAIANGAQTLVSRATAELLHDMLPDDIVLRDLGEHRLKDLGRPERVFQLDAEGPTVEFPPLQSLDSSALRNNLPIQLTSFVGRDQELAEIRVLVDEHRLVTLTGAGGSGKTRLALQVAAEALEGFGEGTWLVELASLDDPSLVEGALASEMGVREEPGHPLLETLAYALSDRRLLLILDNCEHLLDACARLADALLRSCAQLSILATSREPLAIPGEHVYRVPSLSLPSTEQILDAEEAFGYEALRLFTDRARAIHTSFSLDDNNAELVTSICRRLDGMPLAIELATARLASLSLDEVDKRIDERFRLLTGNVRTALPRQQTLRALIDWSHELLDDREQAVLARLAVFAGGWTLEAADAVCRREELHDWEVVDVLCSLVDKSLVQAEPTDTGHRYRLLETVREYAAEKLSELGRAEEAPTRAAHAHFFLALAEEAAPHLSGADQARWFEVVDSERDNLRAAVAHFVSDESTIDEALRIGSSLRDFWFFGYLSQGIEILEAALSHPNNRGLPTLRASALLNAAYLHFEQGDYATAQSQFEGVVEDAGSIGDPALEAEAFGGLSLLALRQGDLRRASELVRTSVDLARIAGDKFVLADALNHRGPIRSVCGESGDLPDLEEALALFGEVDNRFGVARALQNLAVLAIRQGDLAAARMHINETLRLRREMHRNGRVLHASLYHLGLVELLDGNTSAAHDAFDELLMVSRQMGTQPWVAYAFLGLAFCASSTGDYDRAAALHGAADDLFDHLGESLDPDLQGLRDRDHQRLRTRHLGDDQFAIYYEEGRGLKPREAVSLAMQE
jgi:predicted ATPase/class 3 adenylate cyclase/DNA-binding winged helix-turn-helix (wHTH) protein